MLGRWSYLVRWVAAPKAELVHPRKARSVPGHVARRTNAVPAWVVNRSAFVRELVEHVLARVVPVCHMCISGRVSQTG